MESIEVILRYPTRRDDWVKTVLIGGALSLLSFLVIPAVLVSGYVLAVIRTNAEGGDSPPAFEGWGELFVDGLKVWVVGIVYAIVPAALGAMVFGGAAASIATGSDVGLALGLLGAGIGGLVLLAIALVFYYFLPASLANLAVTGRIGAAFDVDTIRPVVTSRAYAVPWLWALGVLIVGGAVANAIGIIPLLGWIAGAVLLFYVEVLLGALWGTGFADALEAEGLDADDAPDVAVA